MRFSGYLTEGHDEPFDNLNQIWQTLKTDCQPFLDIVKKAGQDSFVYRGEGAPIGGYIKKKTPRTDRKPRYVSQVMHEYLSEYFLKRFGWNARTEGVFTGSERIASIFGHPYLFFPTGNFKYVVFQDKYEIDKLYRFYDKWMVLHPSEEERMGYFKDEFETMEKFVLSRYKSFDLDKVLKNRLGFECIFKCDSYYLIDTIFYNALEERIFTS